MESFSDEFSKCDALNLTATNSSPVKPSKPSEDDEDDYSENGDKDDDSQSMTDYYEEENQNDDEKVDEIHLLNKMIYILICLYFDFRMEMKITMKMEVQSLS